MKRVLLVTLGFITFCCHEVAAQIDAQYSQYSEILNYYNPAAVARENKMGVHAIHRMQWVGITNAPQSFFFAADMPITLFKKKHGIGVNFFNDAVGLFKNQTFSIQYAYKLKLWGGELSLGPQLGLYDQGFDASKVHIPSSDYHQTSDEGIPGSNSRGMTFDMAFGAFYQHKRFYVGLSSTHLMESSIELDDKITTYLPRAYYLTGGCNIPIKKTLFEIHPSFLIKTDFIVTQVDLTVKGWYNKMFSGGITYRHNDAVVILLGARIKNVLVGYSYDINTSSIARVSSGSHEMMLHYYLDIKTGNKKNKHKSVRIL